MEIKNTFNPLDPYSQTKLNSANLASQIARSKAAENTAARTETGDRVSLSPEAKLRTEAYSSAMSAPDVRAEKVAALKASVQSGEYQVDSKAVASKLLQEEPGLFQA